MKNNLKKKTWLCAAAMMAASMLMTPAISVCAEEVVVAEEMNVNGPAAETRSSKREWLFKVMNGHLYKRLYNYSTGRWETDWILIE